MRCKLIQENGLYLAWLIALVATAVSLYFSELAHMPVCHLCWYQRICIYPLVIMLGIAAYRQDRQIAIYTIPLSIIGALFALYQYLEQMIPGFAPLDLCGPTIRCSHVHFKLLGFITFPFLSLIACLVITVILFIVRTQPKP